MAMLQFCAVAKFALTQCIAINMIHFVVEYAKSNGDNKAKG